MNQPRQIAAHYILLPGQPLLRDSYISCSPGLPPYPAPRDPRRETSRLEFYPGMIISAHRLQHLPPMMPGDPILPAIQQHYRDHPHSPNALAVIQGANWQDFSWTTRTLITPLA
ncbi:MAG: hypothetical protein LBG30_07340 [Odoribacteraceae bacterium]|jgi:hypothetical protein|nr:hypothetical protein [Odoribacteraceae bacterium]